MTVVRGHITLNSPKNSVDGPNRIVSALYEVAPGPWRIDYSDDALFGVNTRGKYAAMHVGSDALK
jgi:hypothetical protein